MLIILGKTASGKDTIVNLLTEQYGYKKLITYTTRPMRKGEKNDVTYHFISEEEFKNKINSGFFLEYKTYDTEFGTWYYGSAKEDYEKADDKTIVILTPQGYRDLLKELPDVKHRSIYLYCSNDVIKRRLKSRGDDEQEAKRRISKDNLDFRGVEMEVHRVIFNDGEFTPSGIADDIITFLEWY